MLVAGGSGWGVPRVGVLVLVGVGTVLRLSQEGKQMLCAKYGQGNDLRWKNGAMPAEGSWTSVRDGGAASSRVWAQGSPGCRFEKESHVR